MTSFHRHDVHPTQKMAGANVQSLSDESWTVALVLCALTAITSVGCATTRVSNTDRTGSEQLLISNAIDQAIEANELSSVRERNVFIQEKYLDSTDSPYIIGSLRNRVLNAGGRLVDSVDHADVVMEIRSGGIGTDSIDKYIGVPGFAVPGIPFELPEMRVWENNSQFGTAKIAITCFDTQTGQQLEDSGNLVAQADISQSHVLGISTKKTGSVHQELATAVRRKPISLQSPIEIDSNTGIARGRQTWR